MLKFEKLWYGYRISTDSSSMTLGSLKEEVEGWRFFPIKIGNSSFTREMLMGISEKLFSLNKELRDETYNLAQEFDCEAGKQGAD